MKNEVNEMKYIDKYIGKTQYYLRCHNKEYDVEDENASLLCSMNPH